MNKRTEKLFKDRGTPVSVRFGLDLQQVILHIDDWDQELQDLCAAHIADANAGIFELSIKHGIECSCCTKIITESYARPTLEEAKQERHPGRPRIGRRF